MKIRIKRVYEKAEPADGRRILVDRLWPRGLSKERAQIDFWAKDISPSTELRHWYGHRPDKWPDFKARYFKELADNPAGVDELLKTIEAGKVTLLYSAKEQRQNNAAALREYLASRL